jgi:hypothetical protein
MWISITGSCERLQSDVLQSLVGSNRLAVVDTTCSVKSEGVQTTHSRHSDMNLGFSEPDIRHVILLSPCILHPIFPNDSSCPQGTFVRLYDFQKH